MKKIKVNKEGERLILKGFKTIYSKKIEEILLDYGLGKAMEEVENEEEISFEEFKKIINS
jgi:hypothetical protein